MGADYLYYDTYIGVLHRVQDNLSRCVRSHP